jgi:adenylosuccinate synthase
LRILSIQEVDMPATILIGMQWGDEGKGRIADWLAAKADIVARYAGGDNAGHTIRVGDETFKLHLIPSGILYQEVCCVMGAGMVINPLTLVEELRGLEARGIDISPGRLQLATRAHLITPAHRALDRAREAQRGEEAIGTTLRGIGPGYTDKIAREGLRAGEMRDPEGFADRLREHVSRANRVLNNLYGAEAIDPDQAAAELHDAAKMLAPYLADVSLTVYEALTAGKTVVAEGAQGTLLDIDHGGYPFVTSSSTIAGGALSGLGIGPRWVDRVIGVGKAFTTRVGSGPMPTELRNTLGDQLRGTGSNPWDEFGTTTGRPRRTGWLDAVILRYAARINGLTDMVMTKLDILSGFEELKIATIYRIGGHETQHMPETQEAFAMAEPVYETLTGWAEDVTGIRQYGDLPKAAQHYIERVEALVGVPISQITVGPAREQSIER